MQHSRGKCEGRETWLGKTRQDKNQLSQPAPADWLSSPAYGLVSTV